MSLTAGARLGPYQIDALIGAGGMGEVYRARDSALNRDVALKVLPDEFAADPDRLARFRREAQILAALNHPNIAAIYGLVESGTTQALAMELVEGEDLAKLIARGPVPLSDALPIAKQIAEALETAHEQGIVHRDLKPANVKVRADGSVKVLDFGLAKALDAEAASSTNVANSPTITAHATRAGLILGTAAYMAPEQAKGKAVDKRADIWAFGCVLFEMLTGRRAFAGSEVLDVLASVLTTEPNWDAVPSTTPPTVERLLHRCLEKDPRRRLHSIGDARVEVEDALAGAAEAPLVPPRARGLTWREVLPWSIVAVMGVAALGAALLLKTRPRPVGSGGVTRFEVAMPSGVRFNGSAALSPDGRRVAFVGASGAGRQVYVRELDQLEASSLPSTAGDVMRTFFDPDGKQVGFSLWPDAVLKRVSLSGGGAKLVAGDVADYTGSWGRNGQITFVRHGELWQVPAAGGNPKPLTTLDRAKDEVLHLFPVAIGDGQFILFEVRNSRGESHIEAVSAASGVRHIVEESGRGPTFVSSGYLLFLLDTNLVAAPFDADRAMPTAPAVHVLQNVAGFQVSSTGSLLYLEPEARRLVWVSRKGVEEPIGEARPGYFFPALSTDDQHVAVRAVDGVWLLDLVRGSSVRFNNAGFPVWTRDGTHVIVQTPQGMKLVDTVGGQPEQAIAGSSSDADMPGDVTRDGTLAFTKAVSGKTPNVYLSSLDGRVPAHPLLDSPAYQAAPKFSSDGKWIAFVSDQGGQFEVWASRFPEFDQKFPVSTHGGTEPRWSRDGRELFYRSGDAMMAVRLTDNPDRPFSGPDNLFDRSYVRSLAMPTYDVAKDGRFLMIRDEPGTGRLIVVENWIEELKARFAAGK